MITHPELTAQDIRETMQDIGQEHLPLAADGYISTSAMLYDVLMKAASDGISIDAACRDLEQSASGNTIRELLNEQLSVVRLRQHEDEINAALAARVPRQMQVCGVEAALDEHDEPFYGKTPLVQQYTVRGRAKQGTTRFFRIISLYVIYRQVRLTLAVAFVLPAEKTVAVAGALRARLHHRVRALGVQMDVLYLDRGFCSGPVVAYLKEVNQPAILACTIRGKQGGTRQLCRGRKSYRTTYTFTDGTTVEMAAVATLVPGKDKLRRRKWLLYVVVGLDWKPKTVYRRYRTRFGIETSYRSLRRVRVKTTSRNPALRFFLLGFALLLVNLWAFLRWFVARIPGRGPHRVNPVRFQFQAFVCLLRRAIEQRYGVVMTIPIPTQSLES
jgi:Transposase DDE domain